MCLTIAQLGYDEPQMNECLTIAQLGYDEPQMNVFNHSTTGLCGTSNECV